MASVPARVDARAAALVEAGLALVVSSVTPRDTALAQAGLAVGGLVVSSVVLLVLLRAIALGQESELPHRIADDASYGGLHIERPKGRAEDRIRTAIETRAPPPWSPWDEPPDEALDNSEPGAGSTGLDLCRNQGEGSGTDTGSEAATSQPAPVRATGPRSR